MASCFRPNGVVYYHHNAFRIVTTADVRRPEVARQLQEGYETRVPEWLKAPATDRDDARELELFVRVDPTWRVFRLISCLQQQNSSIRLGDRPARISPARPVVRVRGSAPRGS